MQGEEGQIKSQKSTWSVMTNTANIYASGCTDIPVITFCMLANLRLVVLNLHASNVSEHCVETLSNRSSTIPELDSAGSYQLLFLLYNVEKLQHY